MAEAAAIDLHRPLPAEANSSGPSRLAWWRYPVFGLPWFWRRALVFVLVVLGMTTLVVLGVAAALGVWPLALLAGLRFCLALLSLALLGPGLATVVRHARWRLRIERPAVVLAIVFGVACAYQADRWASSHFDSILRPALQRPGGKLNVQVVVKRSPTPASSPRNVVNQLGMLALYSLLGGGLALRAYFAEPRRLQADLERREMLALRERVQRSDLQLAVLQAQVEPHFLFNTLASLRSLLRQDAARAEAMLDALSDHLRATIPRLRADLESVDSTLGQQLDLCESYLALMQVRMGPRLRFEIEVDDAMRALPFPPLLLISLVENAIKHGIEPKAGPGLISIQARREAGALLVRVQDDGRGLQPGPSAGIGLANIREQLRTRYGANATLHVDAREGGGVVASLRLPLVPSS